MEPVRAARDGGGIGGETKLKGLKHAPKLGIGRRLCEGNPRARLVELDVGRWFKIVSIQVSALMQSVDIA
jgi:hypothetical protein